MNFALWCWTTIVIFSDLSWRQSALRLAGQLEQGKGTCVLHVELATNKSSDWGTREYFARIDQRLHVMQDLLAQTVGRPGWLALFDADIVAFRNVSARIDRLFAEHPEADFVVQQETPCATLPMRPCINGGLWAARRTPRALEVLKHATWLVARLRIPDQDALTIATADRPLAYLDSQRYANGYTALRDPHWRAHGAHLVHANWLPSIECKLAWLDYFWRTRFRAATVHNGMADPLRRQCARLMPGTQ